MKKKMSRAAAMLLTAVMAVSLMPAALAAEMTTVDPTKDTGTITLTLKHGETPKQDIEVTLYRVGEAAVDENHNLVFSEVAALAAVGEPVALNELDEDGVKAAIKALTGKVEKLDAAAKAELTKLWPDAPEGTTRPQTQQDPQKSDKDGKVVFTEVPMGVYLVVQTSSGSRYSFGPSLMFLPANGEYVKNETTGKYEWETSGTWRDDAEGVIKLDYHGGGGGKDPDPDPEPEPDPEIPTPDIPTTPIDPPEDIPDEAPPTALPQTGLLQWPIPVMAMAGLMLVVLGAASERKRKNAR